ncbi:MAG: class I SAM-dependent methyltransferase [Elusimicrobiota bacterium]|jgi:SAM-dependent methyltransferase
MGQPDRSAERRPAVDVGALTGADFWDDFWKGTVLPVLPDPGKSYERCYLDLFESRLRPPAGGSVFEAGCAPGMWLAWFHKRFGLAPFGCDISPKGLALTEENLRLCGVRGNIASVDLFAYRPEKPFDVVLSLNFIEHFDNPAPVLDRQVGLLAPGGTLVLSVPNLTGLNAWLTKPSFLAAHNASVMNRAFFEEFAARAGLETVFLGYIGGFEPDLVGPERTAYLRRGVLKALRTLRRLPGAGRLNGSLWSAFLVGLFRKPLS